MIIIYDEARSPDIYYRCRWNSDSEVLYVEKGKERVLYVPGFEYARAKKEVLGDIRVEELKDLKKVLGDLEGDVTIPSRFPHGLVEHLQGEVKSERELFPQRRVKDVDELAAIEQAQKTALEAFSHAKRIISHARLVDGELIQDGEPLTSEFLRAMIRSFLIHRGYDCPDVIVSTGGQTALPHHRGSGPILEGPLIIDIFPQSERSRYHGDLTRTIIVGDHPRAQKMLDAVKTVFEEVAPMCKPGAKVSVIGQYALDRLKELGFESDDNSGLIHALGHGVGLSVHEPPSVHASSDDELQENMVLAIEPGLYYEVGVRHENLVVVSDDPVVLGE